MIHTIEFKSLSAMMLDFVDQNDGLLFLRMAGPEPTVNAIWAKLSAKDSRGKKWGSDVSIPLPGQSYPQYVSAQKHIKYRTLRTRLPNGMIDLALLHPLLTVVEDNEYRFYVLAYDDGMPASFFDRLNAVLSIPLKPEWASWLWQTGQQPQTRFTIQTKTEYENGEEVEKHQLTETTDIPITRLKSLGQVACYSVICSGTYRDAWLQIIRNQLELATPLQRQSDHRYAHEMWVASLIDATWELTQGDETALTAPTLHYLLTQAREELGVHLVITEEASC